MIPDRKNPPPPSKSELQQFTRHVVCADSTECSKVGRFLFTILKITFLSSKLKNKNIISISEFVHTFKGVRILMTYVLFLLYSDFCSSDIFQLGGNVVDAAIATMFCNGVVDVESMGIGGGFIMNIYKDRKFYTLNAKEVAPLAATPNMFKTQKEYELGAQAIGVPGEVKGYWELYKKLGSKKIPWKSLIEPALRICENGMKLSNYTHRCIEPHHHKDPLLK